MTLPVFFRPIREWVKKLDARLLVSVHLTRFVGVYFLVLHSQGRIATPDLRLPMTNASPEAIDRCLAAANRAATR